MNLPLRTNRTRLEDVFYRRLTPDQCQTLHEASLEIMERIGMRFRDDEAVALLRKGGASVSDGDLVRIPQHLVEWAVRVAPRRITLYDQMAQPALQLGWRKTYYGPLSDCLFVRDRLTGERRHAVLNDLREAMQVCEALPNIDFVMSLILASDKPVHSADVHQVRVILEHTTKPIVFVAYSDKTAQYAVALAEAVAGGAEQLRLRPFLVNYINVTSPLRHNAESIRKLFLSADKGLPVIYRPALLTRGMTTPLTMAGFVALNNAGSLAGLVLAQLRREGTPFIREGGPAGTVDQRTYVPCYGRPEGRGFQADLGQIYDLPTFGLAGGSDSKLPEGQAIAEMAMTLTWEALSGNSLVHGIGTLEGALSSALELLPIGDEIIGWLRAAVQGLEISDETLALHVIEEVGFENGYMSTDHSVRHCRDDWIPSLLDPHRYEDWEQSGGRSLIDRARSKVTEILEEAPGPRSFPRDVVTKMDSIIAEADRYAASLARGTPN